MVTISLKVVEIMDIASKMISGVDNLLSATFTENILKKLKKHVKGPANRGFVQAQILFLHDRFPSLAPKKRVRK